MNLDVIEKNYHEVLEEIHRACQRSGRRAQDVRFMAVTKTQPLEAIQELYRLGHRLFGENRVQEAQDKVPQLPQDAEFHLIGHLQSNKAPKVPGLFTTVQSIDKLSTAQALSAACAKAQTSIDILLELNTSQEATKEGVETLEALAALAQEVLQVPQVKIRGLMAMAPFTPEENPIRRSFETLRNAQAVMKKTFPQADWSQLSMGMSNDFPWAIEEGSTLIRVGTRLFGPRSTL